MNLASYKAGNTFKTFILVAAITGLLLGVGFLVGGTAGLILFAGLAVVFNFAMYWFSGTMALKIATWNVNSVRLRLDLLRRLATEEAPDVVCLQETKPRSPSCTA